MRRPNLRYPHSCHRYCMVKPCCFVIPGDARELEEAIRAGVQESEIELRFEFGEVSSTTVRSCEIRGAKFSHRTCRSKLGSADPGAVGPKLDRVEEAEQ